MTVLNRRDVLKGALGAFASWTSARVLSAQQASGGVRRLTDRMTVVDGGGSNVLAFFTGDGFVLVDGGAPKSFDKIMAVARRERQGHTRSSILTITSIRPATMKCSRRGPKERR